MELLISIVAMILSMISVLFSVYSFVWTKSRDRKQATLDAYNILQEQVFDKLNMYTPSEIEEIAKDNRSENYKIVSGLIARIEHFCVGVNTNIYDFKTVYELGHGYFDGGQIKRRIKPIIEKKHEDTIHNYYANISEVWKKMDRIEKK